MDRKSQPKEQQTSDQKLRQLERDFDAKIEELTRINKRLKRKIFDLYTIFEISRHLNTVLDTDNLLDAIILTIIGQMGINGAVIFVNSRENENEFVLARHRGVSVDRETHFSIRRDSCLISHISEEQYRAYDFTELTRDLKGCSEVDILASLECDLLIPMSLKNEICGLLLVTSKISQAPFFEADKDFLLILANQLAVSVENARLFEREKTAYEELSKTQKQLVQSEKLAAVGQLSARVAHEVNNPLGIIKNYLELLAIESGKNERAGEFVTIVREEVDRIAKIVRQLLGFYRPDSGEMKEINIKQLLEETLLLVSVQLGKKRIDVVKKYEVKAPIVMASAEQIKQVFLNLIMNSIDFMPEGGTITVSLETENDDLLIEFIDTGQGIREEDIHSIFEPFFTTRGESSGTGLGLAICESIVRKHRGTISAASHPEGGAEFTIRIPLIKIGDTDE